ncbi:hypothetical protein [Photobacterium damselae]|uniref:hypothetical protein n=1 Tax=Photobacterium damselae TaxID=38293 RepID=UPI001F182E6E|nr:hypothetical protein [Photobacterium damselae]UKA04794.1 hypothetical protein IHC89_21365 [Photobacterium damselae subsp. damselae]
MLKSQPLNNTNKHLEFNASLIHSKINLSATQLIRLGTPFHDLSNRVEQASLVLKEQMLNKAHSMPVDTNRATDSIRMLNASANCLAHLQSKETASIALNLKDVVIYVISALEVTI